MKIAGSINRRRIFLGASLVLLLAVLTFSAVRSPLARAEGREPAIAGNPDADRQVPQSPRLLRTVSVDRTFKTRFKIANLADNRVQSVGGIQLLIDSDIRRGERTRGLPASSGRLVYEVEVSTGDGKDVLTRERSNVVAIPAGTVYTERTPFFLKMLPGEYQVRVKLQSAEPETYVEEDGREHTRHTVFYGKKIIAIVR